MKKFLILIIFFSILSLIQVSLLAPIVVFKKIPNLILISVILFIFFEKPRENFGFFVAFLGGFFIDIFSSHPFGITILFLLFLTFLLKRTVSSLKKISILWFSALSFFALIFYNFFSEFIIYFFQPAILKKGFPQINLGVLLSIELFYSFVLLLAGFLLLRFSKKYV